MISLSKVLFWPLILNHLYSVYFIVGSHWLSWIPMNILTRGFFYIIRMLFICSFIGSLMCSVNIYEALITFLPSFWTNENGFCLQGHFIIIRVVSVDTFVFLLRFFFFSSNTTFLMVCSSSNVYNISKITVRQVPEDIKFFTFSSWRGIIWKVFLIFCF